MYFETSSERCRPFCFWVPILYDDVIQWKYFPRYWLFVLGIHRSTVNSPHKGQWRGALMFSLICVCINGWVNNREAGDVRRYRVHYDVIVMLMKGFIYYFSQYRSLTMPLTVYHERLHTLATISVQLFINISLRSVERIIQCTRDAPNFSVWENKTKLPATLSCNIIRSRPT